MVGLPSLATVAYGVGGVAALIALATLAMFVYVQWLFIRQPGPKLPDMNRRHPLLGNLPEFLENIHRVHDYQKERLDAVGGTALSIAPFGFCNVHITDAASVEHVLKTNFENYVKDPKQQDVMQELLGGGIFNTDGDSWNSQRKTASHIFRVRNFRDHMTRVFHEHAGVLLSKLQDGAPLDMQDIYNRFTLDSIGQIAFGIDIKSLENGTSTFARAFDRVQDGLSKRFFDPMWKLKRAFTKLVAGANAREQMIIDGLKDINEFAYKVIRDRRQQGINADDGDLLSMFMQEKDEVGVGFDDHYLRDMVMNFMIAGRDTTAITLTWATYLLSQHPEIEKKMVAEIDEVLGGETPTYEKLAELKYTQAVVDETTRLYPPVPFDMKSAVNADILPNGYHVRPGQNVAYMIYAMSRDEKRWPEATKFLPERWLERASARMTQYEFPVFNAGPRLCLGQSMAYMEAKMVLAHIYQRYTLEMQPGQDVTYAMTITLPMKNPLMMRAVPRS